MFYRVVIIRPVIEINIIMGIKVKQTLKTYHTCSIIFNISKTTGITHLHCIYVMGAKPCENSPAPIYSDDIRKKEKRHYTI